MKTFLHIWLAPIILGIISAVGLVSALTGDNIWGCNIVGDAAYTAISRRLFSGKKRAKKKTGLGRC